MPAWSLAESFDRKCSGSSRVASSQSDCRFCTHGSRMNSRQRPKKAGQDPLILSIQVRWVTVLQPVSAAFGSFTDLNSGHRCSILIFVEDIPFRICDPPEQWNSRWQASSSWRRRTSRSPMGSILLGQRFLFESAEETRICHPKDSSSSSPGTHYWALPVFSLLVVNRSRLSCSAGSNLNAVCMCSCLPCLEHLKGWNTFSFRPSSI